MPTATKDAPSRDLALRLAHHALRAPLTTLVGYAQLLSAAPLTASQRARAHDQLSLCAHSALDLLERWFAAEASRAPMAAAKAPQSPPAPISLTDLTRDALLSRAPNAQARHVRLDLLPQARPAPKVRLERAPALFALTCLIDAALLESPPQSALRLTCVSAQNAATLRLTRDDGLPPLDPILGQRPADAPFSAQIDAAIALDRGLGTRFCLALAQREAARAHGQITIEIDAACLSFPL